MAGAILDGSKSPKAQISILAAIVFLALAGWVGYTRLDEKKAEREVVQEIFRRMDDGFTIMRNIQTEQARDIRELRRALIPSRAGP